MFAARYIGLGARIKYYRNLKKISQTVLADKFGINRQYLSRIECGNAKPSIDLLFRIADILEVNISLIVKDDKKSDLY